MAELHAALAAATAVAAAAGLLVGFALALRARGPNRVLLGLLGLVVGLAALNGLVGLSLAVSGSPPRDSLHFVYGLAVFVAVPVAVAAAVGRAPRRQTAILAAGVLVTLGLLLRLAQTGA